MKIRSLLLALSLVAAPAAHAYDWKATALPADEHNVALTPLMDAFRFHAEPAAAWFLDLLDGRDPTPEEFAEIQRDLMRATYAAFEYTWDVNGETRTRVYYGRSGVYEPRTSLQRTHRYSNYITQDAVRVHAEVLSGDDSTLTFSQVEGDNMGGQHRNDAELKAVRTIERDIRAGRVQRGGTLHAFVSQPMCDSCEHVVHRFAALYEVDVRVSYLEADMSLAYRRFRTLMQRFMDTLHVRVLRAEHGNGPTPPPAAGACARVFAN